VDEAGRGALAGPVVAAAYRFHRFGTEVPGLDDSKKLSPKKREILFTLLTQEKLGKWSVGEASIEEIEKNNILVASQWAMKRALEGLGDHGGVVLVDGTPAKHLGREHVAVVGGDGICPSIAAASIIAKVTRDRIMNLYDKIFPQYGFSRHKGYPTEAHRGALKKFGSSFIHRQSFYGV